MLQSNLSTRPFYNERVLLVVLALAAAAVLVLTAFNVDRLVDLSRQSTELGRRTAADQQAAGDLLRRAEAIRAGIDRDELERVRAAAREANDLIDRRTFSWTEFFNLIETTLPPDVMLTAVRPQIHEGAVSVSMTVVGRSTADLDAFMEQLEKTGAFSDVLPRQEEVTEQGLHRAILNGRYLGPPAGAAAAPAAEPRTGS
jgi:Tfp pilus assembly protein PilN